jgi:hypothetical protein
MKLSTEDRSETKTETTLFSNRMNDAGVIIVGVLIMLALLSGIAFTAMRISSAEVQIATNDSLYRQYFLTAEAGIDHTLKLLEEPFAAANGPLVRTAATARWDFAFTGSDRLVDTADDVSGTGDQQGDFEGGAVWIDQAVFGSSEYSVVLWNNDESADTGNAAGGDFDTDKDGYVWLRCDATGPRGGGAGIQVLLRGDTRGVSLTGYGAQAGANGGNNSSVGDLNPITDFSLQMH